jgi:hypothetical protein
VHNKRNKSRKAKKRHIIWNEQNICYWLFTKLILDKHTNSLHIHILLDYLNPFSIPIALYLYTSSDIEKKNLFSHSHLCISGPIQFRQRKAEVHTGLRERLEFWTIHSLYICIIEKEFVVP